MRSTSQFDALYASTRESLLLQTYALIGDLSRADSAVRAAYVLAWHHWRKVGRSADPAAWVREEAWRHLRMASTPLNWRRDRSKEPDAAATLAALHQLSSEQRRALVLDQLAEIREDEAQAALATARYAEERGVSIHDVGQTLSALLPVVAATPWPPAALIRREGQSRRRSHTVAAVAVATAVTVVAGALVSTPDDARPTLVAERLQANAGPSASASAATPTDDSSTDLSGSGEASPSLTTGDGPAEPGVGSEAEQLAVGGLLKPGQLSRLAPARRWRTISTTDNTEGSGLVLPCQATRFADRQGQGTLIRSFAARAAPKQPRLQAWQLTELSSNNQRARRAFQALQGWFASCSAPRMQLLGTRTVSGVGDAATLFLLRSWRSPVTTYVVGVARTGRVTTTAVSARADTSSPNLQTYGTWLAAAVNTLCGQPGTGSCAAPPSTKPTDPPPTGLVPGMISEIDMPPAAGVQRPWVGTEPAAAVQNFAATQCDETSFGKAQGVTNALTRTFVVPGARLPDEFGLTQTVGTLPAAKAAGFFAGIRNRIESCGQEENGTDIETLARRQSGPDELMVWRMLIQVSDQETVPYLMGIARRGTAVSQLGFYPAGTKTMGPDAFTTLVNRAQRRLSLLPRPTAPATKKPNKPAGKQQGAQQQGGSAPN